MAREKTIKDCLERGKEERGMILTSQNPQLSRMHLEKSLKNIEVMNYLKKGNYLDWTVIAAYYSMYQACLSILTRIGLKSENHTCTIAVIERYFVRTGELDKKFVEQYRNLSDIIEKIEKVKIEQKLLNVLKDARDKREDFQYDVESEIDIVNVEEVTKGAIEFVERVKILVDSLKNEFIEAVRKDLKEMIR